MSKGFPIVIFICLSSFYLDVAFGRSTTEPLTKQQLQAFLKPYAQLKSLDADFLQKKHLLDLNLDLSSTGRLKVRKPNNIVWTVLTPSFLEVQIHQNELILTSQKGSERQSQKISFDQMGSEQGAKGLSLLVPWLEMDVDKLLKEYSITETSPQLLQFTPVQKSIFKSISLQLAKNNHIKVIRFLEQSGDSIEIEFKAVKIETAR